MYVWHHDHTAEAASIPLFEKRDETLRILPHAHVQSITIFVRAKAHKCVNTSGTCTRILQR